MALKPSGKGLVIETLRYADELQNPEQFFSTVPGAKPERELLSLATELIERKAKPFDPKAFKNQYETALRELIDAKLENRKPHEIEEPQLGGKVIDLMEALKRSVKAREAANSKAAGKPARAAAASAAAPTRKGKAKAKPARAAAASAAAPTRKGKAKAKPAKPVKSAKGRRAA